MREPQSDPLDEGSSRTGTTRDDDPRHLRFGLFELDRVSEELYREGRRVRLTAQPFRLLTLLVLRSGELVTRQEIREHLWEPGVHVEFDQGINALVREIRRALGDDAASPRFLATVPRRGYKFLAPVERLGEPELPASETASTQAPDSDGETGRRPSRRWLWAGAVATLGLLGLAVPWLLTRGGEEPSDSTQGSSSQPILAVLPFDALGPGDSDDLATGLTEDLIAGLGRRFRSHLAVTSPTSAFAFRETGGDPRIFARELGADYLLTGTLQKQDGWLRVSARLTRTHDGTILWATTYRRQTVDLLRVQERVARSIAEALALHLLPSEEWTVEASASTEARVAYLQGRHHLRAARAGQGDPSEARRWFQEAVELDPGFASAWAKLAEATLMTGPLTTTREEAQHYLYRALALDEEITRVHLFLGRIAFYGDLDFDGARRAFERAIEINPSYADAIHSNGLLLAAEGRQEQARAELERASALDPLSPSVRSDACWFRYFARHWKAALAAAERTLDRDPLYPYALECRVLVLLELGDLQRTSTAAFQEAAAARNRLSSFLPSTGPEVEIEETAWRELGEAHRTALPPTVLREYWRWKVAFLNAIATDPSAEVSWEERAVPHIFLGETDTALSLLERSLTERNGWRLPFLAVDPELDPLRDEPRFQELVARVVGPAKP